MKKRKAEQATKVQSVPNELVITGCVFQSGPAKNEPVPAEAIVAIAHAAHELARTLGALAGATKGPEHTFTGPALSIGGGT